MVNGVVEEEEVVVPLLLNLFQVARLTQPYHFAIAALLLSVLQATSALLLYCCGDVLVMVR